MANLIRTFTIPELLVPEFIEVFGVNHTTSIEVKTVDVDGKEVIEYVSNPQSKEEFASQKFDEEIKQYAKRRVVDFRKSKLQASINDDFEI